MTKNPFGDEVMKWGYFAFWCLIVLAVTIFLFAVGQSFLSEASTLLNWLGGAMMISSVGLFFGGVYLGLHYTLYGNEDTSK